MPDDIELWKMKRLISMLSSAKGNGTSMISLILPPGEQVSKTTSMLSNELGTASNIKSRVNRQSVTSAITSTLNKLKLYNQVPPNGLALYCGTILTSDNKEKKVTIDIEPFRPINTSLYLCDNRFHTEALNDLLETENAYGFIVVDGHGTLYGKVQGNTSEVIHKFTVELPKKHNKGGQSSVRFARLRTEKRHNYIRKVAETAVSLFITQNKVNVDGIIIAGSADLKSELAESDLFDQRLQKKILKLVDVSYGGQNGFNQAIDASRDLLADVKLVKEKTVLRNLFTQMATDTGKFCCGAEYVLRFLSQGAVETIIAWEDLPLHVATVKTEKGEETRVVDPNAKDAFENASLVDSTLLIEYLAERVKEFSATLEIVSNRSDEGTMLVDGVGGIAALLRYPISLEELDQDES